MKNVFFLLMVVISSVLFARVGPVKAFSSTVQESVWVPNGTVYASVATGTKLYIGGGFNYVGPNVGTGVALNRSTGNTVSTWPRIAGTIIVSIPDGSGGWYVGGDIRTVGSVTTQRLGHIRSDGTADSSFVHTINGTIRAMTLHNGLVYFGGDFTSVDGVVRNRLAAVNATTGSVDAWNPGSDGSIYGMAATGTLIYVGGGFANVGMNARMNLAALDDTTGIATAWAPAPNNVVETLIVSPDGQLVYIGGAFSLIGADPRNFLGAVDVTTAIATAWNPNLDSNVKTMALSGSTIYIGGNFTSVGGDTRMYLAEVSLASGSSTAWNPNPDDVVNRLAVYGTHMYVGGGFINIGGQSKRYIAELDLSTGNPTAWSKGASDGVNTVSISPDGSQVFIGGVFASYGGVVRNGLAEIDLTTGQATSWDPDANNVVLTLALSPDATRLFAGGQFTTVSATPRNYAASFSLPGGTLDAWAPSFDGVVNILLATNGAVYAGGSFLNVNGNLRDYLAAVDSTTGSTTPWVSPQTHYVQTLALNAAHTELYVGNAQTICRGVFFPPRCSYYGTVSAIKTSDGTVDWTSSADHHVYSIALSPNENRLYVGGNFTTFNGNAHAFLLALNATDGTDDVTFVPALNSSVRTIVPERSDKALYIGGSFTNIGLMGRDRIAALNVSDASLYAWNPGADATVYSLMTDTAYSQLFVGGDHFVIGGSVHPCFAIFPSPTVAFGSTASSAQETGVPSVSVTLSNVQDVDTTVRFLLSGSAVYSSDYTIPSSVVIPAGNTNASVPILPINDTVPEGTETAILTLQSVENAGIGSPNTHTLTIFDDDFINNSGGSGGGGGGSTILPQSVQPPVEHSSGLWIDLNHQAERTPSHIVEVESAPLDLSGKQPEIVNMSLSNRPDFAGSVIVPYEPMMLWDLCLGIEATSTRTCISGLHTVYARYYTKWGIASSVVSDSIQFDAPAVATGTQELGVSGVTTVVPHAPGFFFRRDLRVGMVGDDVKALQQFLNAHGFILSPSGPGSIGNETNRYGAATREAVRRFQNANPSVLVASKLKRGNGVFGPSTRAFVNAMKE